MAKKQTFGDKVLAAKAAQRKMAKVIIAQKNDRGGINYRESMIDQDNVKDFVSQQKA